jgi:hypothetical protein
MNAITTTSPHPLRPQNFGELVEFAKMAARSTLVPRDYLGKPENILLAIQMGSEIGLAPMQSLQNIAVISGRPAVFGDAMLGLCRQSHACKDVVERFEGEGKELTAVCVAKRVGAEPIERRFSIDDAERAGLLGKSGPWQQYPKRMLQMRARGFALRDAFPDVLRGLISTEEAQDIPEEKFTGTTLEASPEREAINAEVPLRAAAAVPPRAESVVDPTVYDAPKPHPMMPNSPVDPNPVDVPAKPERTDEQWRVWLDKLRAACEVLYRKEEVIELGNRASVGDAIANGPRWVRLEISAILAENYARFPEEETDELAIIGEEKVMSGDD